MAPQPARVQLSTGSETVMNRRELLKAGMTALPVISRLGVGAIGAATTASDAVVAASSSNFSCVVAPIWNKCSLPL